MEDEFHVYPNNYLATVKQYPAYYLFEFEFYVSSHQSYSQMKNILHAANTDDNTSRCTEGIVFYES